MKKKYRVDESEWPIVLVAAPIGPRIDADLDAYLERLASLFARATPFALVVDVRGAEVPTAWQRERIRRFNDTYPTEIRRYLRGIALVAPNQVGHALHTAIARLAPLACPSHAFNDAAKAIAWASRQIGPGIATARFEADQPTRRVVRYSLSRLP